MRSGAWRRAAARRGGATRAVAPAPPPSTTTASGAGRCGGGSGEADSPAARAAIAATSSRVIRMNVLRMMRTVKPPARLALRRRPRRPPHGEVHVQDPAGRAAAREPGGEQLEGDAPELTGVGGHRGQRRVEHPRDVEVVEPDHRELLGDAAPEPPRGEV